MTSLWFRKRGRRVTPTILQMEAVECGAVSLAIILSYYGCHIPIETLRGDCGVSRDGSNAGNLLKAARKYGMNAKGFKKEPESLRKMSPPFIVHWNFNHFLIVEGFKGSRVYLNDPAHGPLVVSAEEFDQSFTGVVLTMEPGEEFIPKGRKFSVLHSLGTQVKGYGREWTYLILTGLALAAVGVLIPIFLKIFVDQMLLADQMQWMSALLFGMGVTLVLQMLLTKLRQYALLRLETKLSLSMCSTFIWHVFRLPASFFAQRYAGEIAGRAQAGDRVAEFVTERLAGTVIDFLLIGVYFCFMLAYDIRLAMIAFLVAALNVLYLLYVSRSQSDQNQKMQVEQGKLWGTSLAGLLNLESLKASGRESDFFARWAGYQANMIRTQQKLGVSNQYLSAVPALLEHLNTTLILCVGGLFILNGTFSVGMLLAFQGFTAGFLRPVNSLVVMGKQLQEMKGHLSRLDDVLRYPIDRTCISQPEVQTGKKPTLSPVKLSGEVALNHITFGYNALDAPLLQDISLQILPGSFIAIVGSSGSGKSTIAKVLSGLYEPWAGSVVCDGVERSAIPRSLLVHSIALVDQDIRLFTGTVRDNITLWDTTIPQSVVAHAAKDACIHEEISARPGGYGHMLEEGGRNFSGGQAQRIEIARALAQQPSILIFDEATSALDPDVESRIYANLRRRGCTCIIIAHRLSAIRDCDQIVVLDKGRIAQQGTHDELLRTDGLYASLYNATAQKEEAS
ncbi:NHLP family bacteriocin export ABC transporter peptidase/permease/ATPase subunit [Aneurinibacillus sp. REN35]|uniref:NHLP family bacteriocin export ABC transporter peptidase/permease/ATPase subunit n=1 Tax=Aneurinibacillus sp. REN35 TaxID=3237286 RepID=UPI0035290A06